MNETEMYRPLILGAIPSIFILSLPPYSVCQFICYFHFLRGLYVCLFVTFS